MVPVSNEDFRRTIRILRSFCSTKSGSVKELEERRVARLLMTKYERKLNGAKKAREGR